MKVETLENHIDGRWIESRSSEFLDVIDPATAETIARVPLSTREEVNQAVDAAQRAFEEWREVPPVERARCLYRLKGLMEERFDDLALTIVIEEGKTLAEARGEVRRGIENVEVACGIPSLIKGTTLEDVSRSIDEECIRQPLGVFCCIPPFNFPLMVPLWFLPYAVACGNTYVVKPSEQVPLSQNKLFRLIDEAGFPPGVVNLVNGAAEAAEALLENPGVKGVSFVGSSRIAKHVYQKAAQHGMRAQCHGGAKNFLVVMPDADLARTVASIMTSAFGCAGERCLSGSMVVAVGAIYEKLREKLVESASRIKVGYGLDEETEMGPVVSKRHMERVLGYIQKGVEEGAKLVLDGRGIRVSGYLKGYFIGPTIFDDVRPDMEICNEEIFGPVLGIVSAYDLDEALSIIHGNPYGNAGSIFTSSGKWAREFKRKVRCGNVGVNLGIAAPMAAFPFSGTKDSFFGDLHGQGMDAVQFFTEKKIVITRWF